jgi:hypothetical protein
MVVGARGTANAFLSALKRRPVVLNSATGFVLFASSDAFAQEVERNCLEQTQLFQKWSRRHSTAATQTLTVPMIASPGKETEGSGQEERQFNWKRLGSAGLLGVFFGGFVYPVAYARLDRMFPGVRFQQVLAKSLTEIFSVGIFVNSVSMSMRGLLLGRSWHDDVLQHVRREMPGVTLNDLRLFLPYNLVAFGLLPPYIRPATTVLMESMWQTYISLRSHDYQSRSRTATPSKIEGHPPASSLQGHLPAATS